MKDVVYILTTQ